MTSTKRKLSQFIKHIQEKNYAKANTTLNIVLEAKMKNRIQKAFEAVETK